MTISTADASHIATYLSKGIFDNPNNKDVYISIGETAFIGIERRGHKYVLYIQYAEQRSKADMRSGFNENIKMDVLANTIKSLIESSEVLKDISLNMDKIPMLPQETIQSLPALPSEVTTINIAVATEKSPPMDVIKEDNISMHEGEQDEPPTPDLPAVENKEELPHYKYNDVNDQLVIPDNFPAEENIEILEDNNMNDETGNNSKVESALNAAGLLPIPVDTRKLPEMSYISQTIGNDADIKEKMIKALDQLIIRDRESAVEFYIKMIYRLLPLFNNDIDSAHTGTGIDKRDLLLSVYEIQLFNDSVYS